MSMWLPGGAGASIRSGARTTCRTYCATPHTSPTRAPPPPLWPPAPVDDACPAPPLVARGPHRLQPARHEPGGRLVAVLRHPVRDLGLHPRPRGVAVSRAVVDAGVLRGGHRGQRRGGVVGVLVVAP